MGEQCKMKFKLNRRYNVISIYILCVIGIAMVLFQLLGHMGHMFSFIGRIAGHLTPAIYGVVFAFLLNPMLKTYEHKILPFVFSRVKIKVGAIRVIAMFLTYLTTLFIIAGVVAIVIPQLVISVDNIWSQMPFYRRTIHNWYLAITAYLQQISIGDGEADIFTSFLADIAESSRGTMEVAMERVLELMNESLYSLFTVATNLTASIFNIILGVVISIYILNDRKRIFAQLNKAAVAIFPKRTYLLVYDIANDINRIFSGFVIGRIIDSIIVGVLCFIGMSILGMPHIVLVTVIITITNFVPIFGPFIGAIPSMFIIFTVDPMMAVWFGIFILLLQQLEGNIIGPKIVGDIIGLPPLMIIVSIVLFAGLMGILGMLIGVPLFAILYSMARRLVYYLLCKKGYPTRTMEYSADRNPVLRDIQRDPCANQSDIV